MSVAFDRAASFYDETRSLQAPTMAAVIELLAGELAGRRCLDAGVGTGRIALPLGEAGVPVAAGVDLSVPMMSRLVEKAGGRPPFPLARADVVALPFRSASFDAALVCHVLHLVPAWRDAVAELVRVTRPGGMVLVDPGGRRGIVDEVQRRFAAEAGITTERVGLNDVADLDAAMAEHGARARLLPELVDRREMPLGRVIDAFEANLFAWTWATDDLTRRRAAAAVRPWAGKRFGSLEQPHPVETVVGWRAYDLP